MVCSTSQCPGPKLATGQSRRMNHEAPAFDTTLRLGNKSCCRLQSSYIASMPDFRLCIATDHFPVTTQGKPLLLLLLVTQRDNVWYEHHPVQGRGKIIGNGVQDKREIFAVDDHAVTFVADSQFTANFDHSNMLGSSTDVAIGSMQIIVVGIVKDTGGIALKDLLDETTTFRSLGSSIQQVCQLFGIEGRPVAFALQICIDHDFLSFFL
mmetsp:Transcript_51553/g.148734  ORF Transcript_51553/g.148734 Transcript_51553/m.148734 type:complete len:209 (+) Transcript_51553:1572-2198(+)